LWSNFILVTNNAIADEVNLASFMNFWTKTAILEEKASGFDGCGGWSLLQKRAASG
jgi:hypothetical protein